MVHASSLDGFVERPTDCGCGSGITLNPAKCKLGLSTVEYVRLTIDKDSKLSQYNTIFLIFIKLS